MFGIEALDIVIGLIFIYLLFSLFVSIVNEMLASLLQIRGKELQFVIYKMIGGEMLKKFYDHPRIKNATYKSPKFLFGKIYDPTPRDDENGKENFPDDSKIYKGILPSEIKPETFVKVLEDVLESEVEILNEYISEVNKDLDDDKKIGALDSVISIFLILSDEVKFDELNKLHKAIIDEEKTLKSGKTSFIFDQEYLVHVLKKGVKDLDELREEMENWFEEMMDYATDWYKRKLRWILFALGLFVTIVFNVDSIHIFKTLQNNPEVRTSVVQQAESYINSHHLENGIPVETAARDSSIQDTLNSRFELQSFLNEEINRRLAARMESLNMTSGDSINRADSLKNVVRKEVLKDYPTIAKLDSTYAHLDNLINEDINQVTTVLGLGWENLPDYSGWQAVWSWFLRFAGWIITALALSLGAPFWFDTLKRVMTIKKEMTKKKPTTTENKP